MTLRLPSRARRRTAPLLVAACALLAVGAAPARAADPTGFHLAPMDLGGAASIQNNPGAAAAGIARYWIGYQKDNGDVFDPIYQRGGIRYSQAEWAYTAIHLAVRRGDEELARMGMKAAGWVAARPELHDTQPSSFEDAAMAGLANDLPRLPRSDLRDETISKVSRWLARFKPALLTDSVYHTNKSVVEALAVLEIIRSGAPLPRKTFWKRRAMNVLAHSLPAIAARYTSNTSLGPTTLLSDPSKNPMSYHALTLGYLARAVQTLGAHAPMSTRRTLVHMARGMAYLTAPDGDFAYWGRSQAAAWSLSLGAYGLRIAARYGTARERTRFGATADALLGRLERVYHRGPYGLYWVPAFGDGDSPYAEPSGVDGYANAVTYIAIALKGMAWLQDAPQVSTTRPRGLGAVSRVGAGNGETMIVRTDKVWFAVRPQGVLDGWHGFDLRYDFGLTAAKARLGSGWRDIARPNPQTTARTPDSAGPVLLRGGTQALPHAQRVRRGPGASLTMQVAWTRGGAIIARGTVRYAASGSGVTMVARAPRGSRLGLSIFARSPNVTARTITDGATRVQISGGRASGASGSYGSAYDRTLRRVRIRSTGPALTVRSSLPR